MTAFARLALLVVVTSFAAGCAFSTMAPAHKLERGEVVVQGAVDLPGTLYIPRISGGATFGLGGGDLGFHLGTSILNINAGTTGRFYIGRSLALSLQLDGFITPAEISLFTSATRYGAVTFTPRFGTIINDPDKLFYGGFQLHGIVPFNIAENVDVPNDPGLAAGGYVGIAPDLKGNIDLQFEASGSPIGLFSGLDEGTDAYMLSPTPIVQVGFAVQYRKERRPAPKPSEAGGPSEPSDDGRIY